MKRLGEQLAYSAPVRRFAEVLHLLTGKLLRARAWDERVSWLPEVGAPALLTVSYLPDLELVAQARRSIERQEIHLRHVVVVDPAEVPAFRGALGSEVEIVATPDVVPGRFWSEWERSDPTRRAGWRKQQVVKLSAAARLTEPSCLVVDSDVLFVRPLSALPPFADGMSTTADFAFVNQPYTMSYVEHAGNALSYFRSQVSPVKPVDYTTWPQLLVRRVVQLLIEEMSAAEGGRWWRPFGTHWTFPFGPSSGFVEYQTYGMFATARLQPWLRQETCRVSTVASPYWEPSLEEIHCRLEANPSIVTVVVQSTLGDRADLREGIASIRCP